MIHLIMVNLKFQGVRYHLTRVLTGVFFVAPLLLSACGNDSSNPDPTTPMTNTAGVPTDTPTPVPVPLPEQMDNGSSTANPMGETAGDTSGGTDGDTSSATGGDTGSEPPIDAANGTAMQVGRFLDSAVEGLSYTASTGNPSAQSGVTNSDGEYPYLIDQPVVFSIGDVTLPAVAGQATTTALDVFATNDLFDPAVINLNRLLQTLDIDANPTNGISISPAATASATGLQIDFSSRFFDDEVANLVANSGSSNTSLVDIATANEHFLATLRDNNLLDSGCASTHPAVGRTVQFDGIFHEVAGTLTIVDDCTIEISGFTYDGLGPDVYFFAGNNKAYDNNSGFIIGPRLNLTTWANNSIRLRIPEGKSLRDFNSISVWCFDVEVNFGDAFFGDP